MILGKRTVNGKKLLAFDLTLAEDFTTNWGNQSF